MGKSYQKTKFERAAEDFYPSAAGVIDKLLAHVWVPPVPIWECAAGDGELIKQLSAAGRDRVIGTDLVDRGSPLVKSGVDFLKQTSMPDGAKVIITNPPYKISNEFVEQALDLDAELTIMLLKYDWAGATGPDRTKLVRHVSDIVRLGRLKMLPPGAIDKGHNGAVDFAWFVFRNDVQTGTRIF
jgi:hypothetical protein